MRLGRSTKAPLVCLVCYFVGLTAVAGQANQCANPPGLYQQQTHNVSSGPVFPTDNTARSVGGRELHMLLSTTELANSSHNRKLVVLFYLAGDPPSVAILPVFNCLAAFFQEEVQFVSVAYSELSLRALMSQGLHALPVLQVNAHGRRYRYSGKHWLQPMLLWLARALAQEPVVGLEVAHFCRSQQQLPEDASGGRPGTCKPHSLADAYVASRGTYDRCDSRSMCRREWECGRWDGEVTLEELRAQRPAPLFYISLGFLVLRAIWLAHWWLQRRSRRRAALAVAAPAAAAAAQAAVPAAQAGLGGD